MLINARYFYLTIFIVFISCSKDKSVVDKYLFELLPPSLTGIDFENNLYPTEEFNMYIFRSFYNGGGVAIGDVNNNGLPDIFFAGNMVSNRLYLNRGDFQFEDVTEKAGLLSEGVWSSGVSFADVNGNGLLDIYITKSGSPDGNRRHNELFINMGVSGNEGAEFPVFEEKSAEYGLDVTGLSTHAVFFDYDGDGDLDMYLLNNSFHPVGGYDNITGETRRVPDPMGGSKLFRNDGEYFTNVTDEAGIYSSHIAFGLSVSVADLNRNGWPDIYVANDFFERDYLYLNNKDGTFREVLEKKIQSISSSSMGSDIADLTNNGWPDIYVSDMLPNSEERVKSKMSYETYDQYSTNIDRGFYHQVTRNTLQLNNGDGTFSEAGRLTGTEATDWSWAVLIADYDNNGHNDIYVVNGIYKDLLDQDYLTYTSDPSRVTDIIETSPKNVIMTLMDIIPSEPVGNVVFSGEGELKFTDRSIEWGLGTPGFSSGAAWGDLNGNGSLDLVVNDVNGPARIYRNRVAERHPERTWLRVDLQGQAPNTQAIGAQLQVWSGGQQWYREHMLQRGFLSSVAPGLHVGLGEITHVDSLRLRWPDGRVTRMIDIEVPARLSLAQSQASDPEPVAAGPVFLSGDHRKFPGESYLSLREDPLLEDITDRVASGWSHQENDYVDFTRERLLVHMRSTEGPALCTGDVTGNGFEDVYIGGARGQAGALHVQSSVGFKVHTVAPFEDGAASEDTDCVLFDANGNGHLDLYVASGGNSFSTSSSALMDRLYMGDGQGGFEQSGQVLPTRSRYVSSSSVAVGDLTGNGHPDLFVGERLQLFAVGMPGSGFLLANDGTGTFTDVTAQWAPELSELGMITDAAWTDWDGDGREDLVIVGEWMHPRVFVNRGDRLEDISSELGLEKLTGWWNAVHVADISGNERPDLVLGNHGLNSQFKASQDQPVRMWAGDFQGDGMIEQILSMPRDGQDYPVALRHELIDEIHSLREAYPDYASYGGQTVKDIFEAGGLSPTLELQATELGSLMVWNEGGHELVRVERLPLRAQLSPMYGIWSGDLSGDGYLEVVLGGNLHEVKPIAGRYDGSYGVVIGVGDDKQLRSYPPFLSGLKIEGSVRKITSVDAAGGGLWLIIARNNDTPAILRINQSENL